MTSLFVDQFLIRAYLGECQLAEVAAGTALSGPVDSELQRVFEAQQRVPSQATARL